MQAAQNPRRYRRCDSHHDPLAVVSPRRSPRRIQKQYLPQPPQSRLHVFDANSITRRLRVSGINPDLLASEPTTQGRNRIT